jgi:MFS family permease
MPLPEVSDRELELAADKLPVDATKRSIGGLQLRTVSLILAVFAQYMYVAGQESNSIYFRSLLVSFLPEPPTDVDAVSGVTYDPDKPPGIAVSIPDYLLIGHTAFVVSRLLAAAITYFSVTNRYLPQPRTVLTVCVGMCVLFSLLPVVLQPANPDLLVIPVMFFYFAEGPIWPLIFAIGLRGQGRRTKRAAAFITMGGSGPAFFPFVMYAIINNGGSVQTAYIVIIALQGAMAVYPIFLQCSRSARLLVDTNEDTREAPEQQEDEQSTDQVVRSKQRQGSSGVLGQLSQSIRLGVRKKSQQPHVQHNEGVVS